MSPERIAELRDWNYNASFSPSRGEVWHEMLDAIEELKMLLSLRDESTDGVKEGTG